jgi:hypothetical protein
MSLPASGSAAAASGNAATAAVILQRQDEPSTLRWLLAQRRMYSRAKRWNYIRVFGIGIIALGAPIITVIIPHKAEIVGAIAAGWVFLARTTFLAGERRWARPAASVQDAFDSFVFGLSVNPTVPPQPERIADILGDDDVEHYANKENLLGWYSLEPDLPMTPAIAIGVAFRLTLSQFLMGVVLPVLPAVIDARELWYSARSAADDRSRLSDALADRIRAWPAHAIKLEELRSWQDRLFILRRDGPLVPDFLYHWTRAKNERAMSARGRELANSILANTVHDVGHAEISEQRSAE